MFDRIVSDPAILGGKPVVKGTRLSVGLLLELVASGGTVASIVEAYPHLAAEDVEQALRFAAYQIEHEVVVTTPLAA
ncbi:MAG: DUF433 domain-containing protein [Bacteroidota bacterium]